MEIILAIFLRRGIIDPSIIHMDPLIHRWKFVMESEENDMARQYGSNLPAGSGQATPPLVPMNR